MKIGFTKRLFLVAAACMVMAVSGCNEQTAVNTIHSLDDLQGKKIGVQLKTTGDVYASDI
ncbi:MAG: hypothetical protein K2P35_03850 [Lachnospiraceae bacterium]|nr:hypothetical protein [Lachnospiraceae bacterium]